MATVSGEATAASIMPTAASIRATAASDMIQASPGVSAITGPCYAHYVPPVLGLLDNEHVLRDGNIGRPMVLSGEENAGVKETEIVLRGGRLEKPFILFGSKAVNKKKFIKRQKANPLLARFLAGGATNFPLQRVTIFKKMRDRMHKHCRAFGEDPKPAR